MTDNPFSPYTREMVEILRKMDRTTMREWLDYIREFISRRAGKPIPSIHDYLVAPDSPLMPIRERFDVFSKICDALKARDPEILSAASDSPGDQAMRNQTSG